jgi:hypothetical protein
MLVLFITCRSIRSPLPGAGVTFFAAAKKVTKESSFFSNRTMHKLVWPLCRTAVALKLINSLELPSTPAERHPMRAPWLDKTKWIATGCGSRKRREVPLRTRNSAGRNVAKERNASRHSCIRLSASASIFASRPAQPMLLTSQGARMGWRSVGAEGNSRLLINLRATVFLRSAHASHAAGPESCFLWLLSLHGTRVRR